MKNYRSTSLWFHWDDLIYPDKGVEEKFKHAAVSCRRASIDLVIVFGFHFRWDHIYLWNRVHELFRFVTDVFHAQGIKVFDYHSANLTHRPATIKEEWNIALKNRHHVPFYPSRELIGELTLGGVPLNDFRMIDIQTGKACYLPAYEAEIYCMNNEKFRSGYRYYLGRLMKETGIDGLMCDDIVYYPRWKGCGCSYCRAKFKSISGMDLPGADNIDFWGNYDNPAFRQWVRMRYQDSADFLNIVRNEIGVKTPLLSCTSGSCAKALDANGENIEFMLQSTNHLMLEMCGEIAGLDANFKKRVPDIMHHQGISLHRNTPSLGLGYAYYPDTAFFVWALDKLFGASTWISTLKGRLGIPEKDLALLPDEWDICGEGFAFEKNNPALFSGKPANRIALLYSLTSKINYGDHADDYETSYKNTIITFFEKNADFDVCARMGEAQNYPMLVMTDTHCLSDADKTEFFARIEKGGTAVIAGSFGTCDETGAKRDKSFLRELGIEAEMPLIDRSRSLETFFSARGWPYELKRKIPAALQGHYHAKQLESSNWIEITRGKGKIIWTPARVFDRKTALRLLDKINGVCPAQLHINAPAGWNYRVFADGKKKLVHFISGNFKPVASRRFCNNLSKEPVIEHLRYKKSSGKIKISSIFSAVRVHSPDLSKPVIFKAKNGCAEIPLKKIQRYCVLELY